MPLIKKAERPYIDIREFTRAFPTDDPQREANLNKLKKRLNPNIFSYEKTANPNILLLNFKSLRGLTKDGQLDNFNKSIKEITLQLKIEAIEKTKAAWIENNRILNDLAAIANDKSLPSQMGAKYAQDFRKKFKELDRLSDLENTAATPAVKRKITEQFNVKLKELNQWCQEKTAETTQSIFNKIGGIITKGIQSIIAGKTKSAALKTELDQIKRSLDNSPKKQTITKLANIQKVVNKRKQLQIER